MRLTIDRYREKRIITKVVKTKTIPRKKEDSSYDDETERGRASETDCYDAPEIGSRTRQIWSGQSCGACCVDARHQRIHVSPVQFWKSATNRGPGRGSGISF